MRGVQFGASIGGASSAESPGTLEGGADPGFAKARYICAEWEDAMRRHRPILKLASLGQDGGKETVARMEAGERAQVGPA